MTSNTFELRINPSNPDCLQQVALPLQGMSALQLSPEYAEVLLKLLAKQTSAALDLFLNDLSQNLLGFEGMSSLPLTPLCFGLDVWQRRTGKRSKQSLGAALGLKQIIDGWFVESKERWCRTCKQITVLLDLEARVLRCIEAHKDRNVSLGISLSALSSDLQHFSLAEICSMYGIERIVWDNEIQRVTPEDPCLDKSLEELEQGAGLASLSLAVLRVRDGLSDSAEWEALWSKVRSLSIHSLVLHIFEPKKKVTFACQLIVSVQECSGCGVAAETLVPSLKGVSCDVVGTMSLSDLVEWLKSLSPECPKHNLVVSQVVTAISRNLEKCQLGQSLAALSHSEWLHFCLLQIELTDLRDCMLIFDQVFSPFEVADQKGFVEVLKCLERQGNAVLLLNAPKAMQKVCDKVITHSSYQQEVLTVSQPFSNLDVQRLISPCTVGEVDLSSGSIVVISGGGRKGKTCLLRDEIPGQLGTSQKAHYIDGLSLSRSDRTIVELLGVYDEIVEFILRSYAARHAGIEKSDLSRSKSKHLCAECAGSGVVPILESGISAGTFSVCWACSGSGFEHAIADLELGGVSLRELFTAPLRELLFFLERMPGVHAVLIDLDLLGLSGYRLVDTLSILARCEQRALLLYAALLRCSATKRSKSPVFLLDNIMCGLQESQVRFFENWLVKQSNRGAAVVLVHPSTVS